METQKTIAEIKNLSSVINSLSPVVAQIGKSPELLKINKQLQDAVKAPVTVLVCGEFKRGKSTFVNALLGRSVCATDVDICTSVVSVIRYGAQEKITRYYGDFSDVKEQVIDIEDLERYTVGSASEIDNTLWVDLELPVPVLKEGLVIIDTPGVGGLDPRHAALTKYFIPRADIALFMTDVNEPLTTTELEFYEKSILPYARQSAVVVNKADLRETADVAEFMCDTVGKVSSHCKIDSKDVSIVAVSSAAELYPDQDLGESNFAELWKMVGRLVDDYRAMSVAGVKSNLLDFINNAITPLQAQLDQIQQPDIDHIKKLNDRKVEIDAHIAELTNPNSDFRKEITEIITAKREEFDNRINDASVILQTKFNELIHTSEAHSDNGGIWLGERLNDLIAEISAGISADLTNTFDSISRMPVFEGMLQFSVKEFGSKVSVQEVDTSVPIHKRLTPAMSGVGIATVGATYIATGGIGIAVALVVGACVAIGNIRDSGRAHIESNLRQNYQPQLSGVSGSLRTYVNSRFSEFQQKWVAVLSERAQNCRDSLKEAIDEIQKLKQDASQAVTQRATIVNRLKPLMAAKTQLEQA